MGLSVSAKPVAEPLSWSDSSIELESAGVKMDDSPIRRSEIEYLADRPNDLKRAVGPRGVEALDIPGHAVRDEDEALRFILCIAAREDADEVAVAAVFKPMACDYRIHTRGRIG